MIDRTRPPGSGPSSTRTRGGGSVPARSTEAPKVEEASRGGRFGFFEEMVRDGVVVVDLGDREAFFEAGRQPALLLRTLEPATGLRISGETLAVQTGGDRLVTLDAIEGWILVGLEGRTLAIRAPQGR